MKIILHEEVPNLGKPGEVVTVREGYGRNYLLPQKKAVLASEKNLRQIEHQKGVISARQAKLKAGAEEVAKKIGAIQVKIARKVGEQDKLYGSVTNKDIADAVAALGVEIDRHAIELAEPIRALGEFSVNVKLHHAVAGTIKVTVVAET
jgi:large subunit ribosomal protein L9